MYVVQKRALENNITNFFHNVCMVVFYAVIDTLGVQYLYHIIITHKNN